MHLSIDPHPSLRAAAFVSELPRPLGEVPSPPWLAALLALEPPEAPPVAREESLRAAVRDCLRHGGYRPTGRGKPSAEYLVQAVGQGQLASINLAVDLCNAVSLHSGFPISVVDLERASEPLRVGLAPEGARYVFNASGQEIDMGGLLCLFDAQGPCANAVKDAQRTKTSATTRRTLSLLWGCAGHEARLAAALGWYRELARRAGLGTLEVELAS